MKKIVLFLGLFLLGMTLAVAQTNTSKPQPFSLDALEYRSFLYFWETTDTLNWQVPDRWPTESFSSIAATGFGLSSYIVGAERKWISREQAADRILKTLRVLQALPQGDAVSGVSGYQGFFYHFLDFKQAQRFKDVELSSIDTGLLLMGILSCQSYFDGNTPAEKSIREIADALYRRVDWNWMLNQNNRLSMGWRPERGFIPSEWSGYNEAMLLYVLALGSPTHPIPQAAWQSWCNSYYWDEYMGQVHVNFGPLFGHQYSQTWIDFRGIQDAYMREKGIDYFENSRRATLANYAYCQENPKNFKGYSDKVWGLTASDGPMDWAYKHDPKKKCKDIWEAGFQGYSARGVATDYLTDDGTLVPTAAGGSVAFAPEICIPALQAMWETYYDSLVGDYGFKDAFNPSFTACGKLPNGWFDVDYLGIDQGPILLMIENYRSQLLWNIMKKNPYIVAGLQRAGFQGGWLSELAPSPPAVRSSPGYNPDVRNDPMSLFERHHFKSKNGGPGLPYRYLKPQVAQDKSILPQQYPLLVFLHGAGERGNDNAAQMRNGVLGFVEGDHLNRFPCYLLVPQCPRDSSWAALDWRRKGMHFDDTPNSTGKDLEALIMETLKQEPGIDPFRVYIVGISNGGFGTFEMLQRRPDLFAAAIPASSGGEPSRAKLYKDVPIWVFHGQNDPVVPVDFSRATVQALEAAGGKPNYTEYTTLGHAIWQETFYNEKVLEWLFAQHKRN
ncbi:MAG: prolyl oligopeptidase family serine peptidase [Lewinellaceae bacterium]|nr:prolyl oligopeptidase family serine peptidase [Lewinellaceae bacterium]